MSLDEYKQKLSQIVSAFRTVRSMDMVLPEDHNTLVYAFQIINDMVQKGLLGVPTYTTKTIEMYSKSIPPYGSLKILDYRGSGRLVELTIISSSPNFTLAVSADGTVVWGKTFSEASALSDEIVSISAFQREDGKYIYFVSDIEFKSSISIEVVNLDSVNYITLDYIFCKYEVI